MSNSAAKSTGGDQKARNAAVNSPIKSAVSQVATPPRQVQQTRADVVGKVISSASGQVKAQELKAKKEREEREAKAKAEREAAEEAAKPKKPILPPTSKASDAAQKHDDERKRKKLEERRAREAEARAKAEKAAAEAAARAPKVSKASEAATSAGQRTATKPQPKKRYGKPELSIHELLDAETRRPILLLSERPDDPDAFEEASVRFRRQDENDDMQSEAVLYREAGMLEKHIQNLIKTHRDPSMALFNIFVFIVNGPTQSGTERAEAYGYVRKGKSPDEQSLYTCLTQSSAHLGMLGNEKAVENSLRTALGLARELQKLHEKGIVFHGSLCPEIITIAHTDGDATTFRPEEGVSSIREILVDTHSMVLFKDLSACLPSDQWCAPELRELIQKKWSERTEITGKDAAVKLKAREQADIFTLGAILFTLCEGKVGAFGSVNWWVADKLDQIVNAGHHMSHVPNLRILARLLLMPDSRLKGKINLKRVIDYLSGDESKAVMMSKEAINASTESIIRFLLSPSGSVTKAAPP